MAAIQEYRELNPRGASKRADGIHGRPAGAAGVNNIVHENEGELFKTKGQIRFLHTGGGCVEG